jgi:hypothetical protein
MNKEDRYSDQTAGVMHLCPEGKEEEGSVYVRHLFYPETIHLC